MNKKLLINAALYLYMAAMTFVVTFFSSKIWRKELWPNERFTVVVISSLAFIILLIAMSRKIKDMTSLLIYYHAIVIFTVLMMLIPYEFRPLMAVFMIMTLMAGLDTGLICALSVSVAVSFLSGAEQEFLYGTLLIGAFSCFAADMVKNRIKFIISSIILFFSAFFINGVFQYYETDIFDYGFALISLVSIAVSLIIYIKVNMLIRPRSEEPYIREDSETVRDIKEKSISLYYHSQEVADLSYVAAQKIQCNARLAYAGGLLHAIGKTKQSDDSVKAGLIIANKYGMPREIKAIMVEYDAKHRLPSSREAAIVMLAQSVVSSVEYLKQTDKEVSEKKIIDNVFNVRLSTGALDKSGLSVGELSCVKSAFEEYFKV